MPHGPVHLSGIPLFLLVVCSFVCCFYCSLPSSRHLPRANDFAERLLSIVLVRSFTLFQFFFLSLWSRPLHLLCPHFKLHVMLVKRCLDLVHCFSTTKLVRFLFQSAKCWQLFLMLASFFVLVKSFLRKFSKKILSNKRLYVTSFI